MPKSEEPFELREGKTLVVPRSFLMHKCKSSNRRAYPDTPMIIRLDEVEKDRYAFRPADKKGNGFDSFVLFVPDDVKPGTPLTVSWVDANCACARAAFTA